MFNGSVHRHIVTFFIWYVRMYVDEPQITVKPVSQIVFQGESFFLDCASKGTPEIMRRWYKDGVEVVPSEFALFVF